MSQPELRRSSKASTAEATHESESHSNTSTVTPKKRAKSDSKSPKIHSYEEVKEEEEGSNDIEGSNNSKNNKKAKKEQLLDEDTKEPTEKVPKTLRESGESPPESLQGEVTKENSERKHGVLEKGHIYFIYRPKVELEEAHSVDEISRLQILLLPAPETQTGDKKNYRLLVVGRKRIPKTGAGGKHEVLWGKVIATSNDLSALREKLGAKTYQTKTLGERHLAPARIVARGHYILTSPASNLDSVPEGSKNMSAVFKTYLAYQISVPNDLGDVQHEMRIEEQGAFGLQIRNPDSISNNPVVRDPKENQKAAYPKLLKQLFTTKFIPANPPSLLNFAGAEILMIGSSHSVGENIGTEVLEELEGGVEKEQKEFYGEDHDEEDEDAVNEEAAKKALAELGMQDGIVEALEGHWV